MDRPPKDRPADVWYLVACGLLCFLLALAGIARTAGAPASDELEYHRLAVNLLAGHGYAIEPGIPILSRPPLYPLWLAAIYAVFGERYEYAWYAQAVIKALTVFPVYYMGRRLFARNVALGAAALFAIHPSFELAGSLYRENLLGVLLALFLWALLVALQDNRPAWFAGSGALAGCLALGNTVFLFLPVALCLLAALDRRVRAQWPRLAGLALVALLLYAPWQARAWLLTSEAAREEDRAYQHLTLLYGQYPVYAGTYWWTLSDMAEMETERAQTRALIKEREARYAGLPAAERLARDRNQALALIAGHPVDYLKLVVNRALIFLASPPPGSSTLKAVHPALALAAFGLNGAFVAGALGMLLLQYRRDPSAFGVVGTLVYLLMVYGLLHAIRRYGYVMVPVWCVYGTAALRLAWTRALSWQGVRASKPRLPVGP